MRCCFLMVLAILTFFSYGQDLNSIYKESIEAHKSKDYTKFVALNKEALNLHPSQPTFLYNLATGYSLTDSLENTYQILKKLLSWNNKIDYQKDADFNNLLLSNRYTQSLDSLVNYYGQVKGVGYDFALFKGKRHLEDLVLLDSLLFATDVYHGELLKYNTKKNEVVVVKEFDLPVLALASKPDSYSVWVSTAKIHQSKKKGIPSNTPEIVEIDALKGKLKSRVPLDDDFVAGSMVFDKDDNLYISNSSKSEIIIIDTKTNTIKQKLPVDDGFNLQGITIDLDRNILYVADYIKGVAKVDIANDYQITWFQSDSFLLKGIDGLAHVKGNKLLAIQNNSSPKRVIQLSVNGSAIETVRLLDNNLNTTSEPTNGKYYEKLGFLYIANSSWPHYNKNGEAIFEKWEEQKVLQIRTDTFLDQ
ncbi:hypothetical protein [Flagellimonas meridianipacifica]|uniref:DNA-binding beta-propeller fold protein YncE n=1 Tax=Flagellimonas meridianipacifica TaxID=1080225 RepID=A0A2T0M8Z0_9FLAO|nr:hypothetical protein [Allomuricauda pacifica]PRX53938.1 hypothetical protein CLV81_2331 [Allomuricauda pacifica]